MVNQPKKVEILKTAEQKETGAATPAQSADDQSKEGITIAREKLKKGKKEGVARVEKAFDRSKANLPERAFGTMEDLKRHEEQNIEGIWEKYEQKFGEVTADTKQDTAALNRAIQANQDSAKEEAETRLKTIEELLVIVVGDRYTPENIAVLARALQGAEKLAQEDKETQAVLGKLEKGLVLDDQDYQKVLSLLAPQDLLNPSTDPQKIFEASSAGLLITLMHPDQRYKLIEHLMEDPTKKTETAKIMESFLSTGILSVVQGKELLDAAAKKNPPIIEPATLGQMEGRLHSSFYQKQSERLHKAFKEEANKLKGNYAENLMNRIVGPGLVGVAGIFHSIILLLVNLMASHFDAESIVKNPYIVAGGLELAVSTEIVTGTMVGARWGLGHGWVTRTLVRMKDKVRSISVPDTEEKREALNQLGDIYANDLDFADYLNKGGGMTILELRKKKEQEQKKDNKGEVVITYADLLQAETDPDRKAVLEKDKANFSENTIGNRANEVGKIASRLQIKDQATFDENLKQIKMAQGLKA